eukprot:1180352-Prorocentrum_minimum.AAC.4
MSLPVGGGGGLYERVERGAAIGGEVAVHKAVGGQRHHQRVDVVEHHLQQVGLRVPVERAVLHLERRDAHGDAHVVAEGGHGGGVARGGGRAERAQLAAAHRHLVGGEVGHLLVEGEGDGNRLAAGDGARAGGDHRHRLAGVEEELDGVGEEVLVPGEIDAAARLHLGGDDGGHGGRGHHEAVDPLRVVAREGRHRVRVVERGGDVRDVEVRHPLAERHRHVDGALVGVVRLHAGEVRRRRRGVVPERERLRPRVQVRGLVRRHVRREVRRQVRLAVGRDPKHVLDVKRTRAVVAVQGRHVPAVHH